MSEEAAATPEAPKPKKGALIAAVLVAAVAGSGAGVAVIGPMLAKPAAAAAPADGEHAPAAEGEHAPADSAAPATAPVVLSNIVMNPAGSRGTRFLLVSVGFEFSPRVTDEEFANRETEIRDVVIGVLSAKTVDDLVDYTKRDGYRAEIATAIEALLAGPKVRRVFFPQFVIQ